MEFNSDYIINMMLDKAADISSDNRYKINYGLTFVNYDKYKDRIKKALNKISNEKNVKIIDVEASDIHFNEIDENGKITPDKWFEDIEKSDNRVYFLIEDIDKLGRRSKSLEKIRDLINFNSINGYRIPKGKVTFVLLSNDTSDFMYENTQIVDISKLYSTDK